MVRFSVNGEDVEIDVEADMPLLWVLREELGLRGTKFGCGIAQCGACTVHVDGAAVRSCSFPVSGADGAEVRTIEGLGSPEDPHPVQRAWIELQVPQCGYCQPGMQMAAAALLDERAAAQAGPVTDEDVRSAITNICRCGCYERIRQAVVTAGGGV